MATWTPEKRKTLYELLAVADLESAIRLVEPFKELHQKHFLPENRKALAAFAAKAVSNKKISARLAGLIAYKNVTLRSLGLTCVLSMDAFYVEFILAELRTLLFDWRKKRPDLWTPQKGSKPQKEFAPIFNALAKAAWNFDSPEIFEFGLEFDKEFFRATRQAKAECRAEIKKMMEHQKRTAGKRKSPSKKKGSNIVKIKFPDVRTSDVDKFEIETAGTLAWEEIRRLKDRWIEKSAAELLERRGYEGAVTWLYETVQTYEAPEARRIVEDMFHLLVKTQAKRLGSTESEGLSENYWHIILSFDVPNPDIYKHVLRPKDVLRFIASAMGNISDQAKFILRYAGSKEQDKLKPWLQFMERDLTFLDKLSSMGGFDPVEAMEHAYFPADSQLGWNLYNAIPWRKNLQSRLPALVKKITAFQSAHRN